MRGGLAFFGDSRFFPAHGVGNSLRFPLGPDTIRLDFSVVCVFFVRWVEPFGRVFARNGSKRGVNFPVIAADEFANFLFPLNHHRQRRRLYPAHGGQKEATVARVKCRHGAGAIDADQPVGLGTTTRGVGQRQHLGVRAQMRETVADGLRRHRLQPQARDRVLGFAVLLNQAKDQLALAPGIAGVDERAHVFAFGQFDNRIEPRLGLVHRLQVKVRRNDGQIGKAPFAAFDVKLFGRLNLQQMPHGTGDDVGVVLEMFVQLLKLAGHRRECFNDVLSH